MRTVRTERLSTPARATPGAAGPPNAKGEPKGRVLIAMDRRLIREALAYELRKRFGESCVLAVQDDQAREPTGGDEPSVIILDCCDGDGDADAQATIQRTAHDFPTARILVLCEPETLASLPVWLSGEIGGCFTSNDPLELLMAAVGVLMAGGVFFPAPLVRRLLTPR
ncbi:response regulator transcription factor [Pararhizobium mangrovi]|uniref:Response regulator transcription factor n=1 Tax=Pararhizobium mangrovi TaxID=2590452 RepID=A0A506U1G0_9HYPH|nr:response regulator transcription factor [Pararhizobium mangrovi]TPW28183.1 response regulator transcription factor [Pararhizobium mangrovi]